MGSPQLALQLGSTSPGARPPPARAIVLPTADPTT